MSGMPDVASSTKMAEPIDMPLKLGSGLGWA